MRFLSDVKSFHSDHKSQRQLYLCTEDKGPARFFLRVVLVSSSRTTGTDSKQYLGSERARKVGLSSSPCLLPCHFEVMWMPKTCQFSLHTLTLDVLFPRKKVWEFLPAFLPSSSLQSCNGDFYFLKKAGHSVPYIYDWDTERLWERKSLFNLHLILIYNPEP